MQQLDLFGGSDQTPEIKPPVDPEDATQKITGTSREVLRELLRGPCTSTQLEGMTEAYKSRLLDLRKRGYDIRDRRLESGLVLYYLVQDGK